MSLQKLTEEYNAAREAFMTKTKLAFNEEFQEFFKANPAVKALTWTQYTPHFNDGDTCYFGVHDFWPVFEEEDLNGLKDGELSPYDMEEKLYELKNDDEPTIRDFTRALHALPAEFFEDTFGDHCQVIATPEGFEVTEFEHD